MTNLAPYRVYSASAGSGKTFTLVKEYLQIILQSKSIYQFQNILAITFTNKAAAEMKQRVISNLQSFAREEDTEMLAILIADTGLERTAIQQKSKRLIEVILQNYSDFSITTIDSFTYRIIRSFAYDFGLSMDFDIEMDAQSLLEQAVDAVISKIGVDQELTKVLVQFSLDKSDEDKTWDISNTLNRFASVLLNESDKTIFNTISDRSFSDYQDLAAHIEKQINSIKNRLVIIGKSGLEILRESELEHELFNRKTLPNFYIKLAENVYIPKVFQEGKIAMRFQEGGLIKKSVSQEKLAVFESCLPHLWDFYKEAEQLYSRFVLLKLFKDSLVPLSTLSYIHQALEALKLDLNVKLIAEFNEMIFSKVQNEPTPFIYERLGEKYTHYFIDEMQDTSRLQWLNLIKLIENAITQEGGSLLLVGDAKQSIYRWRGGESEQFIDLADPQITGPFSVEKEVKSLDTNFRSFSEIIDFNNDFFQHTAKFLNKPQYKELYIEGNKQKKNSKSGGYVQIDFLEKEPDNEFLFPEKVLQTIQNLEEGFQWKDVCVLVRKNKDAVQVATYLLEHNIDVVSSESLLLASDAMVLFITHVFKSVLYPQDHDSKLRVLSFLHQHLDMVQDKHEFYSEILQLEGDHFYSSLDKYGVRFNVETFQQKSLYDAVEYCVRAFDLSRIANTYLFFFLEEVLNYQEKNSSDFLGFLEYWDANKHKLSISVPEGKNAVQIMTIHKSKGLQFPVVIFPYDMNMFNQIDPKVWYPVEDMTQFNGFKNLLIPYRVSLQFTDDIGAHLYQERQDMLALDSMNLLYVTLTRAVEQLYIITEKKSKENVKYYSGLFENYLKQKNLWEASKLSYCFGTPQRLSKPIKESSVELLTLEHFVSTDLSEHHVKMHDKEALLWQTEQGDAVDYGNLVHRVMESIYTEQDVEKVLLDFLNRDLITAETREKLRTKVYLILRHPELSMYFQSGLKVYNEQKILTTTKDIIIPDRLVFLPDNQVVVIDYKTGHEDTSHIVQIQKYATALEDMGYRVNRKILLYIGEEIKIVG